MSRRASFLPALAAIGVALTVAAFGFASWHPATRAKSPTLTLAANQLRLTQTKTNQALIRLPNAKPGRIAKGSTRLSVTGARARVTFAATNLRDVAGPNGGRLIASNKLRIAVSCTGSPCPGSGVAYQGPLSKMGRRSLGTWAAGTRRTYTVRVWIMRGATPQSNTAGDNAFQGSRARFGLLWTASAT